jgi:hypothetical protein
LTVETQVVPIPASFDPIDAPVAKPLLGFATAERKELELERPEGHIPPSTT